MRSSVGRSADLLIMPNFLSGKLVYPTIHLSSHLSACLSSCPSAVCQSINLCFYLSSVYLCLAYYLSVCLPVCLSLHVSMYLLSINSNSYNHLSISIYSYIQLCVSGCISTSTRNAEVGVFYIMLYIILNIYYLLYYIILHYIICYIYIYIYLNEGRKGCRGIYIYIPPRGPQTWPG